MENVKSGNIEFEFVNKCRTSPATKNGELKLNDIIEVKEEDGVYYRIYLNNSPYYAETPANNEMLKEFKDKTWTLDNKERSSKLVKSNSDSEEGTVYLSDVLEKFGYDSLSYEVYPKKINKIPDKLYDEKRK
ncbi:hypothetical protein JOC70_000715 [Clostridium pascui]|uniref:hypothetical protein n=1 Tax=Clostridium pascui TaxID=46609 RepID=UPI00195D5568|nr:hypothetical protein [Clostridium pascui]MBM7869246.1 hypothetical protein [Clostridium pascui]